MMSIFIRGFSQTGFILLDSRNYPYRFGFTSYVNLLKLGSFVIEIPSAQAFSITLASECYSNQNMIGNRLVAIFKSSMNFNKIFNEIRCRNGRDASILEERKRRRNIESSIQNEEKVFKLRPKRVENEESF